MPNREIVFRYFLGSIRIMVVIETESICANCSACSMLPLNNGFYSCRRYDVVVTLNDVCETIDILEVKPIRQTATHDL